MKILTKQEVFFGGADAVKNKDYAQSYVNYLAEVTDGSRFQQFAVKVKGVLEKVTLVGAQLSWKVVGDGMTGSKMEDGDTRNN